MKVIKNIIESAVKAISGRKKGSPARKAAPFATTTSFLIAPGESDAVNSCLTNPAQCGTWVYSCIQRIAEAVAQVPFKISRYKPKNENLIETGRLYELLQRPHPMLNQFDFFELIVCWLMVRGKTFIIPLDEEGKAVNLSVSKTAENDVVSLFIASPDNFKRILSADGKDFIGWRYKPGSATKEIVLFPEEVLYIRLPFVNDFWDGYPPLAVAALAAQADVASAQYMKAILSNNGEAGLIIKSEQYLTDEQRSQIISALHSRKRGIGVPDRPIILEAGLDIVAPTLTSADLQFLENRKFNRQEICAVFGVPQEILGFTEDANRSVSETARLNFFENRIIPLCKRIEAGLKPLITHFGTDLYGWFDVDATPIMRKKRLDTIQTAERLWQMGIPFNDINRYLELGLPRYSWHNSGYISSTFRKIREVRNLYSDLDED